MQKRTKTLEKKKKLLSVCVRLFIEQGYHSTSINQITKEAGLPASYFQNIYRTKDAVLQDLIEYMFHGQFKAAHRYVNEDLSPVYVYAVETAIQLALTEANENIRQIYVEAYEHDAILEYINLQLAKDLHKTFSCYSPGSTLKDFYETDIGSSCILRAYMAKSCDVHFTLDKKIEHFLSLTLRTYRVPEDEILNIISYICTLDIYALANAAIQNLFTELEVKFNFFLKNSIN